MITTTVITTFDDASLLRDAWNQLLKESKTGSCFLTYEWCSLWWKHFGAGKELCIIAVKDDAKLIGLAPLMASTKHTLFGTKRVFSFIGTPEADNADIISGDEPTALDAIVTFISEQMGYWDALILEEIPSAAATVKASPDMFKKHRAYAGVFFANPYLIADFSALSPAECKAQFRKKDVERKMKALSAEGSCKIEHISDSKEAHAVLEYLYTFHETVCAKKGRPSIFTDRRYREFYRELAAELMPRNEVIVIALQFNGMPIAVQFGFHFKGSYHTYTISYDTASASWGPGIILFSEIIRRAPEVGIKEINFGRGDESYKYRFSNREENTVVMVVHKNRASHLMSFIQYKSKEYILRHQKLHAAAATVKNSFMVSILPVLRRMLPRKTEEAVEHSK